LGVQFFCFKKKNTIHSEKLSKTKCEKWWKVF
jgi:hypothetical protein